MIKKIFIPCLAAMLFFHIPGYSQLVTTTTMTPQQLVQSVLIGTGVVASNVTYNGSAAAIGFFTGGMYTNLGLHEGVVLSTGNLNNPPPPGSPVSSFASTGNGTGSDPQLASLIPGYTINDAAVLEFDFIPESDTIKFRYVFGSEEYPEWVSSSFNDVFGFFVSGPNPAGGNYTNVNIAIIPGTSLPVTIDNINNVTPSYPQYYVDNQGMSGMTVVYDGFTVVLTAWIKVVPCQQYHIKIAVGDAGDSAYDSAVFLEKNSFSSASVQVQTAFTNPSLNLAMAVEGCQNAIVEFTVPYPRADSIYIPVDSIYGTATNGVDYVFLKDSVLILPGHLSANLFIQPLFDNIPEGIEYVYIDVQTSVCYASDTTLIVPIIDYNAVIVDVIGDTAVCQTQLPLSAVVSGGAPPYYFSWTPINGLSDPDIVNPIAFPTQTTQYILEVWDSTECSIGRDSITVTVNPRPLISFQPDVFSGCEPVLVKFFSHTIPAIQDYVWHFGDGDTSHQESPVHTYHYNSDSVAYNVTLTVRTPEGCIETYAVNKLIKVYLNPEAEFYADPDSTSLEESLINFVDLSSSNAVYWSWNFDDTLSSDNTSDQQNPTHLYLDAGVYNVLLEVKTENGCTDTVSHIVKIMNVMDDSLKFPNVFTPNGDGYNDRFEISNLEAEHYLGRYFIVFNRWGKKIYEKNSYFNEWDGSDVPDGTYYFVFRYTFSFLGQNTDREVSGTITLIR